MNIHIKEQIEEVLESCPRDEPIYLKNTEWLADKDTSEIEQIYDEYQKAFEEILAVCEAILGSPNWTHQEEKQWINKWYPEAIYIACWIVNSKVVYIAVEHHDRDTPVGLVVNCLEENEVKRRSA